MSQSLSLFERDSAFPVATLRLDLVERVLLFCLLCVHKFFCRDLHTEPVAV